MSLKEISSNGEYELCVSLMLQYVYGKGGSLPSGPDEQGLHVRQVMLGGSFWQATQMRHLLVCFLGRIITVENCLRVLQNAGEWKETELHQRANSFIEGLGMTELQGLLDNRKSPLSSQASSPLPPHLPTFPRLISDLRCPFSPPVSLQNPFKAVTSVKKLRLHTSTRSLVAAECWLPLTG